ncbi:MAG: SDR family oxidoreductase [Flavobacteriales bacterium]|nr:SDR family oxidoreductase [Flavobacteriales bacterium]
MADSSMKDKTVIITGGNAGIGRATAEALARKGAQVTIIGRSEEKLKTAVSEIQSKTQNENISYLVGDLASFESVKRLISQINAKHDEIDVLINNAGVFYTFFTQTTDGFETQFQVNHLSHFLLTQSILDRVKDGGRIINLTSRAHRRFKSTFEDLRFENNYDGLKVYSQSKLANILYTYELSERLKTRNITVNCIHPGGVATNIAMNNSKGFYRFIWKIVFPTLNTIEKGAETSVYLASSNDVKDISGEYFADCKVQKASEWSKNLELRKKLWDLSCELTGLN